MNNLLHCNPLITLIRMYPKEKWEWKGISANPLITPEFVMANPRMRWCWQSLSQNPSINIRFVKKNLDKPWNWTFLSANKGITIEDILGHPEFPWKWNSVSSNPNLNIDHIIAFPKKDWNWSRISMNPIMTPDVVNDHPDLPWDFWCMSYNPSINYQFVILNSNKNWLAYAISKNEGISMEDIQCNVDDPIWIWSSVGFNPNITMDFMKWNTERLTLHDKCVMNCISSAKNITMKDILDNPQYRWNWSCVSLNPNITYEFIKDHKERIDFGMLSRNKLTLLCQQDFYKVSEAESHSNGLRKRSRISYL